MNGGWRITEQPTCNEMHVYQAFKTTKKFQQKMDIFTKKKGC